MNGLARAALVMLLCTSAAAFAEKPETEAQRLREAAGVTEHGPEVLWGWLNFILLAGGLGYLIKKHAGPYLAQRSLEIRKSYADAEAAKAASDAKVADIDRRLANLETEIAEMRLHEEQEAETETLRARRDEEAELAKIQTRIAEEIASATKSATLELRRHAAELALALAEQKIAARLTPETQDRLVGQFVATMTHVASGAQNN